MNVQRQIDDLRARRAAEWFEIMSSGATDRNAEFVAWLTESPRHLSEFLEITALSQETRQALREKGFDRALLVQKAPGVASMPPLAASIPRHNSSRSIRRWVYGLAASIVCGGIVLASFWTGGFLSRQQEYATAVGEQRTITLADGSIVYLNARSEVLVRLEDNRRDIELLEGEALFKVAQDERRPFRVRTREAVVQAIGTQFNVAIRADGTRVAVIEGKVQVSTDRRVSAPPNLVAGEAARISASGIVERRPPSEAANAIAWRQRQLVFEGTSLEEAVEEFNRYQNSTRLRLEGVSKGSHHYSGTWQADDPESFAELLSRDPDLRVERRGGEIIIRGR